MISVQNFLIRRF